MNRVILMLFFILTPVTSYCEVIEYVCEGGVDGLTNYKLTIVKDKHRHLILDTNKKTLKDIHANEVNESTITQNNDIIKSHIIVNKNRSDFKLLYHDVYLNKSTSSLKMIYQFEGEVNNNQLVYNGKCSVIKTK